MTCRLHAASAAATLERTKTGTRAPMSDHVKALGVKLCSIRQQQGLSLLGVEHKSGGQWKATVVGSYERGDRAATVQKLTELAGFYGIPVNEPLPHSGSNTEQPLRRQRRRPRSPC